MVISTVARLIIFLMSVIKPIIHRLLIEIKSVLFVVGRIELREDTLEVLLSTACLLQLSEVVSACCAFLKKQLHPSNCIGICLFADTQGCLSLRDAAHGYTTVSRCLLCCYKCSLFVTSSNLVFFNQTRADIKFIVMLIFFF